MMTLLLHLYDYLLNILYNHSIFQVVTIISAVVLFCLLFWKGTNMNYTSVCYVSTQRPNIPMVTVHNPFTFQVNLQNASFKGIECTFSCSKNCCILPVWGVPICHLYDLLNLTWMEMRSAIMIPTQDKFSSKCTTYNDLVLLKPGENRTVIFRPPYGFEESVISCQQGIRRQRYSFVAIMILQNMADVQEGMMVAMATPLHLKDSWMNRPSYIIGKYLKPKSGAVGLLKKIFLSSPESVKVNGETFDLCIVCYHRAVSVVILPCCHASLCGTCLELCENCPVCRGPAFSYFELYVG